MAVAAADMAVAAAGLRCPLCLLLTTGVFAEPYPTRAIRIVVPYAPGGNSDLIARALAARVSESLGQPVIVENRPVASAIIGSDVVAKAPPDGYTLLLISSGNLTTNPTLFAKLPLPAILK
jgi:tripartite-type tricarboxylate transporter receptor subunit TctC